MDVLVDSLNPTYYLAIECKSILDKKLYFSQHFHTDKKSIHQVDAITDFLKKTGRAGFLAIEFRFGAGKANEAYLIPWAAVIDHFRLNRGISLEMPGATLLFPVRGKDTCSNSYMQSNFFVVYQMI